MADVPQKSRQLEPSEQRVMDMVNTFNRLTDEGAQFGKLTMTAEGLNAITRHDIAMPIRVVKDPVVQRYIAYFPMIEFQKYLAFACNQVGFTLLLNGGVKTEDGLIVGGTFPQDAIKPKLPKKPN